MVSTVMLWMTNWRLSVNLLVVSNLWEWIFFFFKCLFILRERGTEGGERIPSWLLAASPELDMGRELTNCEIMT